MSFTIEKRNKTLRNKFAKTMQYRYTETTEHH